MIVIGHRGSPRQAPENTPVSFEIALDSGAEMVEFDVRICASGDLVVFHDDEMARLVPGLTGGVENHTLGQLTALDLGRGEGVPAFAALMDRLRGRVSVNIELKGAGTGLKVASMLSGWFDAGAWRLDEVLVSSFLPGELAAFRRALPGAKAAVLAEEWTPAVLQQAGQLGAWSVNLDRQLITTARLREIRAAGHRVLAYTVNEADEALRLRDLGVEGIFTDDPGAMKAALKIPGA